MTAKRECRAPTRAGTLVVSTCVAASACSDAPGAVPALTAGDERGVSAMEPRGGRGAGVAPASRDAAGGCRSRSGELLPSGEVLYRIPGDISDLARMGDALYYVGAPNVVGGPGEAGVFRVDAAGGGTPKQVVSAEYGISSLTVLDERLYANAGLDGLYELSAAGASLADWSSLGNRSLSDGAFLYTWHNFSEPCDDAEAFGIRRMDAEGEVETLDADARCIQSVAAGDDDLYWLEGDPYADISGSPHPIRLFRTPKAGGGPRESLPLGVTTWRSLQWSEGYAIGTVLAGFERGRPEDAEPEVLAHGVSELSTDGDGALFFAANLEAGACLVQVRGAGELVPFGSYDIDTSPVDEIAADQDFVYFAMDAEPNSSGLNRETVIRRIRRP